VPLICHPEPRRRRRTPSHEPRRSFAALRQLRMTRSLHADIRDVTDFAATLDESEGNDLDRGLALSVITPVIANDDHDPAADPHRSGSEVADADVIDAALDLLATNHLGAETLRDVLVQLDARRVLLVAVVALGT